MICLSIRQVIFLLLLNCCLSLSKCFFSVQQVFQVCPSLVVNFGIFTQPNLYSDCVYINGYLVLRRLTNTKCKSTLWGFPKLREIRQYLAIEDSSCQTNLSLIFPSLVTIGSESASATLKETRFSLKVRASRFSSLGLINLRRIAGGGVALLDNPNLCFYNSINWYSIISKSVVASMRDPVLLRGNKLNCPDNCPNSCPKVGFKHICWSPGHCQKICADSCSQAGLFCQLTQPDRCCHPECAAGCTGPSDRDCLSCNHIHHQHRCIAHCPPETALAIPNRANLSMLIALQPMKCVSNFDNEALTRQGYVLQSHLVESPSAFTRSLKTIDLAPGLNLVQESITSSFDLRPCGDLAIYSVNDLSSVEGCISAKSVLIGLRKHPDASTVSMMARLTRAFSSLSEVSESVRVVRSDALFSLSFLAPLRRIGHSLVSNSMALSISWNENVVALWNGSVAIAHGGVDFRFNWNLCPSSIEKFIKETLHLSSNESIQHFLNGERARCYSTAFEVTVVARQTTSIIVKFDPLRWTDPRRVLPETVILRKHSTEQGWDTLAVGEEILSYVPGSCDSNWLVYDPTCRLVQARSSFEVHCHLDGLEAYTRYEGYIEINTLTAYEGARSLPFSFVTVTDRPGPVGDLRAKSIGPNVIRLSWQYPRFPGGPISHFELSYRLLELDSTHFNLPDACQVNSRLLTTQTKALPASNDSSTRTVLTPPKTCHACADSCFRTQWPSLYTLPTVTKVNDTGGANTALAKGDHFRGEFFSDLALEDALQRSALQVRPRRLQRRDATSSAAPAETLRIAATSTLTKLHAISFKVSNLHHYSEYVFTLKACQKAVQNERSRHRLCGPEVIATQRTELKLGNDEVSRDSLLVFKLADQMNNFGNETSGARVRVAWLPPSDPNGLVYSYRLRYRRLPREEVIARLHVLKSLFNFVRMVEPQEDWTTICVTVQNIDPKSLLAVERIEISAGGRQKAADEEWPYRNQSLVHTIDLPSAGLNSGVYTLQLKVISLAGNGSWTSPETLFQLWDQTTGEWPDLRVQKLGLYVLYWTLGGVALFMVTVIALCVWLERRHRKRYLLAQAKTQSYWEDMIMSRIDDEWEIDPNDLAYTNEDFIGRGSFGMVYKGALKTLTTPAAKALFGATAMKSPIKNIPVAIKPNATFDDMRDFLSEASYMKQFEAPHLVQLLGICSRQVMRHKQPYVLMELMELGDLATYLRGLMADENQHEAGALDASLAIRWSAQIADGMYYLAKCGFIHRDLATRNCLVSRQKTVKIGDFGLTRDVREREYYRKEGQARMPIRWMAPETLQKALFTHQSDVWSYGMTLWEIGTFASLPYSGMSHIQVINFVTSGSRLENPNKFPDILQEIIDQCWKFEAEDRITFAGILEAIEPFMDIEFRSLSYFHRGSSRLSCDT